MPFNSPILGTVIASVLQYDHLIKITGDPAVVNPKTSQWIPADGRDIGKSQLSNATGLANAPDLRGRFLRGLNTIYSNGQPTLIIGTADEDDPNSNRKVGIDYQGDSFRLHAHSASGHINGSVCGSNGTHDVDGVAINGIAILISETTMSWCLFSHLEDWKPARKTLVFIIT